MTHLLSQVTHFALDELAKAFNKVDLVEKHLDGVQQHLNGVSFLLQKGHQDGTEVSDRAFNPKP